MKKIISNELPMLRLGQGVKLFGVWFNPCTHYLKVVIKPLIVLLTTVVFSFTNKIDSYQMPSKRAFDPDPNCLKFSTIFPHDSVESGGVRYETDT